MDMESRAFEFDPSRLEIHERRLPRNPQRIPLRGKVFGTLVGLVTHHGSSMTKAELMAAI